MIDINKTTAKYLVLDLTTNDIREEENGPMEDPNILNDDKCRTTELWLRRIEAGKFVMGSPEGEIGRAGDEVQHEVTISNPFYIGVFEITQKQQRLISGFNKELLISGYCTDYVADDTKPYTCFSYDILRGKKKGASWPKNDEVDDHSFVGRLRAKTNMRFDLPTEAQWEYACRAGTTTAWNNGKDIIDAKSDPELDKLGYYRKDESTSYLDTKSVGSYLPNAWGLYDMHGNFMEGCLDWSNNYSGKKPVTDPRGGDKDKWGWGFRIARGRGDSCGASYCRAACRGGVEHDSYSIAYRAVINIQPFENLEQQAANKRGKSGPRGKRYLNIDSIAPQKAKYLVIDLKTFKTREEENGPAEDPAILKDDKYKETEIWFRRVEPGTFLMGSPKDEKGRRDVETQHEVTISRPFYIGVFPITEEQYEWISGDCCEGTYSTYNSNSYAVAIPYSKIRGENKGSEWPASGSVDKNSFLGYLRSKTNLEFDLPTEAQWEYACRAGTTSALNSGKDLTNESSCLNMAKVGKYKFNKLKEFKPFLPNALGLYDMHGSVWEWCLDWYQDDLGNNPVTDPKGPENGEFRAIRGGSLESHADCCRSASRTGYYVDCDRLPQIGLIGFRLVINFHESAALNKKAANKESKAPSHQIKCLDIKSITPRKAKYLVLDLDTYKIREEEKGPMEDTSILNDDKCKTTELWLRRIEPGTFTMGSPEDELGRKDYGIDVEIQHKVTISQPFYIGVFPMTQKQYRLISGDDPSFYSGDISPVDHVSYDMIRGSKDGAGWPDSSKVDDVSFLGILRSKTNVSFDIPTEAQWEYACRAGTTTALNSGKNLTDDSECPNMDEVGCYRINFGGDMLKLGFNPCCPVGMFLPNAWGLFDMHGNINEWCLDWYRESLGRDPVTDPKGPHETEYRVLRGGDNRQNSSHCRAASRKGYQPYRTNDDMGGYGFRVVINFNASANQKQKTTNRKSKAVSPKKKYTDLSVAAPKKAKYLVLDLLTYKVREEKNGPKEDPKILKDDKCKTTELWLRRIEPGTFLMGDAKRSPMDKYDTPHEVTITKPFYIGVFEITQKQYQLITGCAPSRFIGDTMPVECVSYEDIRGAKKGSSWPKNNETDEDSFLGQLRAKTNLLFDIPTDAKWEYACRAGTTTDSNNGQDDFDSKEQLACTNCDNPLPVGTLCPNPWGLYDMHGNVKEWCLDWHTFYLGSKPVVDPKGAKKDTLRVTRGVSYERGFELPCNASNELGFRVVLVQE